MEINSSKPEEVVPTEDVVNALLEYLVDPFLRLISSEAPPSEVDKELVAKQMHAVVLLYNYYERKRHPETEYVGFEPFCKLAVTLKPSLMLHMKLLVHGSPTDSNKEESDDDLSKTEKAILDACNISLVLDPSKDIPSTGKWPFSKVAVLLIDANKENCFLSLSSVTKGVWSFIEKDVDISNTSSESKGVGKRINKRKINNKKTLQQKQDAVTVGFQQLAYSAVKEVTGINQADLMVLETHVVYSLSREKTAARFYIMQGTQSLKKDNQFPLQDLIQSLQGPLVKWSDGNWMATAVAEFYHVLPYAGIVSDWFSREVFSNSLHGLKMGLGNIDVNSSQQTGNKYDKEVHKNKEVFCNTMQNLDGEVGSVNVNSTQRTENPSVQEVTESRDVSDKHYGYLETSAEEETSANTFTLKQKDNMDVDKSSFDCPQKDDENENTRLEGNGHPYQKKRTPSTESNINPLTSSIDFKAKVAESKMKPIGTICRDDKVDTGKKICSSFTSDKDEMPTGDRSLIPFHVKTKYPEKAKFALATEENKFSQTALEVLCRKREKLAHQSRTVEDEIAVCDQTIQTILDGADNDMALRLGAIMEGCNDGYLQANYQDQVSIHKAGWQGSSQQLKRKRLSEAILSLRSPCQELDDICTLNNWKLPTYCVRAADGGFLANVRLKGIDFDWSGGSDLWPRPAEARESAAAKIISKLQNLANPDPNPISHRDLASTPLQLS
ncbi:hypothetical protein LguiB_029045 [Lonicera macranthoides]